MLDEMVSVAIADGGDQVAGAGVRTEIILFACLLGGAGKKQAKYTMDTSTYELTYENERGRSCSKEDRGDACTYCLYLDMDMG
jgi:hypothetical protein